MSRLLDRLVADEPTAQCVCCGRTLPADDLFLRDDWQFICAPCHGAGDGKLLLRRTLPEPGEA